MLWYLLILKTTMIQNKFSELIFSDSDLCDLIMQGHNLGTLDGVIVDHTVDPMRWPDIIQSTVNLQQQRTHNCSVPEFHQMQQSNWHMPDEYKNLDIAKHVLELCQNETELQRCGKELLLFQERNLFDLLRYLKYVVDVMKQNGIIWGVGRGSSVASFVLYRLEVHRINSIHYNLDIEEFLR
jgi:DNA polymerase III alpha subunit